jgi:hypothetical protein
MQARKHRRVIQYRACVSFVKKDGKRAAEEWPVMAFDHQSATNMAFHYAIQVLRLTDFELTVIGS